MGNSELVHNFVQYLKYHDKDRDPRLVAFYIREILKEAWANPDEITEDKESYAEKRRADLVKRFT